MPNCFGCVVRDEALKALRSENNLLRMNLEMSLSLQRSYSDSMRRLSQQVKPGQDAEEYCCDDDCHNAGGNCHPNRSRQDAEKKP